MLPLSAKTGETIVIKDNRFRVQVTAVDQARNSVDLKLLLPAVTVEFQEAHPAVLAGAEQKITVHSGSTFVINDGEHRIPTTVAIEGPRQALLTFDAPRTIVINREVRHNHWVKQRRCRGNLVAV